MRKVFEKRNVNVMLEHNNDIYYSWSSQQKISYIGDKISKISNTGEEVLLEIQNYGLSSFYEYLVFTKDSSGSELYIYDLDKIINEFKNKAIIDGRHKLKSSLIVGIEIDDEIIKHRLTKDLSLEPLRVSCNIIINDIYLSKKKRTPGLLARKDECNKNKWQADLSQIGLYKKMDGTIAEQNEIDGELLYNEELKFIYVPMAGGQLVALEADSGQIIWIKEHIVRRDKQLTSGKYSIIDNSIYKTDGASIIEISAKEGEVLKKLYFEDIQNSLNRIKDLNDNFICTGPINVYSDVIVLFAVRKCQIVILNRQTLELIDFVHIPNIPGIPNSKKSIVWHNNQLHILDLENTLHIFGKET